MLKNAFKIKQQLFPFHVTAAVALAAPFATIALEYPPLYLVIISAILLKTL
jgi:hypothetical protein